MNIPVIRGIIDRRILVNFQVDPEVLAKALPDPFRPVLAGGQGIAGVCLIRLKEIRPRFLSLPIGIGSENAAHRIAAEWNEGEGVREGVYIPRRDTSSRLTTLVGGSLFPGVHSHATFDVHDGDGEYSISLQSADGETRLEVAGRVASELPSGSVFATIEEASNFFQRGALGYSATAHQGRFDGLELRTLQWHVEPLEVDTVYSSFFSDQRLFPSGSVRFDCALLMRGIEHEWHAQQQLCGAVVEAA